MVKLIAVTGATGNQGGSVAKRLLQFPREYKVRALTRNPDSPAAKKLQVLGAEVAKADLTVPSSLEVALRGCWGVFGVTNFYDSKIKDDPGSEEQQGKNLVDASLKEGIQCFVWSTLPSSAKLSGGELVSRIYEGKHHVDDYIRETDLPATFLYTGNFLENMIYRNHVRYEAKKDILEFHQAIIRSDTKLAMLYVEEDLADIAKAIFDKWETQKEQIRHAYLYASNGRFSPNDIVGIIEKVSGRRAIYNVLPTTGVADRDIMFELYNRVGMYPGKDIPDQAVLDLGVGFHSVEEFIRDKLLPHLGLNPVN
ncbi:NAD(P)-binding protein [Talaromyces proteolyticus]|uniref:NAD(P)-binding protein n=1 Tax=Talaromyces proteolyticus TaxID=1131652 RepID=A0AAD4PS60_9EURO|nr:NAD(P)-binding protein [Talaromyces proteolyticus]KAH8690532.1 NAD(P)-binding protein [Talaromyces proteolyticus]